MNITIVEKLKQVDTLYRQDHDKYHIRKFNTFYDGMNKTTCDFVYINYLLVV